MKEYLGPRLSHQLLNETLPSFQAISPEDENLGLGHLYYGFTRTLRPKNVCVIGSKAGFSVVMFAQGLKDNCGARIKEVTCWDTELEEKDVKGKVFFVDPSYSSERNDPNNWYGIGFWDNEEKTKEHWKKFGLEDYITHYKMTSAQFLEHEECPDSIDLLFIDGDHSFEGISHDFNAFYNRLSPNAVIMAHDVDPALKEIDPETGGFEALNSLDPSKFESFRLPVFPGLAIVRKK
jgi:predicted O-methyltransferase YrrM